MNLTRAHGGTVAARTDGQASALGARAAPARAAFTGSPDGWIAQLLPRTAALADTPYDLESKQKFSFLMKNFPCIHGAYNLRYTD